MQIVPAPYRCQKLKESGFPQEGCEFYYHIDVISDEYTLHHITVASFDKECMKVGCIAAHTVEEMMEWLKGRNITEFEVTIYKGRYRIISDKIIKEDGSYIKFTANTISNALADMVAWVLEKEGKICK